MPSSILHKDVMQCKKRFISAVATPRRGRYAGVCDGHDMFTDVLDAIPLGFSSSVTSSQHLCGASRWLRAVTSTSLPLAPSCIFSYKSISANAVVQMYSPCVEPLSPFGFSKSLIR